MAEQMPEEVRKFAESARAEGWSDDDIIAYMQKQSGGSNTPAEPKMTPRTADLPTIAAHRAGARLGTVYEEGAAPEEGLVSRTAKALNSAANPEGAGDVVGLMLPTTMGAKAIRMGIPAGARIAEKVGGVVAEGANMLKKHSPLAAMVDVLATRNPIQGAMVAAAPYGAEWAGRTLQRVGSAIKNFKPWEFNANSPVVQRLERYAQETPEWPIGDTPRPTKGMLGPGAHRMESPVVTPDQIINPRPMSKAPEGPIFEGEILNEPKGLPAPRSTQLPATMEAPTTAAGTDSSYVRAERGSYAQVERPGQPPSLKQEVQRLSAEGLGAEDIADRLKGHPEMATAGSRAERTNMVREARGGAAGGVPAGAKRAIDAAIAKLQTVEEKRAYLMRAPNGAVYDYIRGKLGL